MLTRLTAFIQELYGTKGAISLHAPQIGELEKKRVMECLDAGFVSTAGKDISKVEQELSRLTRAKHSIAVVNGTAALHSALMLLGVRPGDAVILQSLTFVATANAVKHAGAMPEFVDVDSERLSLCPEKLREHLTQRKPSNRVGACILMHTFGHPGKISEIKEICRQFNIPLIEDAAESLGSTYKGSHTGTFGDIGTLSFNGNKIATAGGGGALLINDNPLSLHARHITTTAKRPHPWEFYHDEVGWNYRMPNLNAALLMAQLERLPEVLNRKRNLASSYRDFFKGTDLKFIDEPLDCNSNFWLNSIICPDRLTRDSFLEQLNLKEIQCRPLWVPMHKLPMFEACPKTSMETTEDLYHRVICLPSGVVP